MAEQAQERDFNDVGTFVSNSALGFVQAGPQDIAALNAALKRNGSKLTKRFLDHLLTIKMLAPNESRDLMIQPTPQIEQFVASLRQSLVIKYYFTEVNS